LPGRWDMGRLIHPKTVVGDGAKTFAFSHASLERSYHDDSHTRDPATSIFDWRLIYYYKSLMREDAGGISTACLLL
jgi:hypothetical protein